MHYCHGIELLTELLREAGGAYVPGDVAEQLCLREPQSFKSGGDVAVGMFADKHKRRLSVCIDQGACLSIKYLLKHAIASLDVHEIEALSAVKEGPVYGH